MQYHISTELGDDANPGTHEKPWKILAHANAHHYKGGDRLLLRGGEIFPGSLSFSPENVTKKGRERFTIQGYGLYVGEEIPHPIIEAGAESAITLCNLAAVTVQEIEVRGSGYDTNTGWGVCALNDTPRKSG